MSTSVVFTFLLLLIPMVTYRCKKNDCKLFLHIYNITQVWIMGNSLKTLKRLLILLWFKHIFISASISFTFVTTALKVWNRLYSKTAVVYAYLRNCSALESNLGYKCFGRKWHNLINCILWISPNVQLHYLYICIDLEGSVSLLPVW